MTSPAPAPRPGPDDTAGRTIDPTRGPGIRWGEASGPTVRRAIGVALVVGTALSAINELDLILTVGLSPLVMAKIALNYFVPFGVSLYSAVAVGRHGSSRGNGHGPASG
jgi:hypothetical protein